MKRGSVMMNQKEKGRPITVSSTINNDIDRVCCYVTFFLSIFS
jgi:hypothetical protein